jgi:hypothetical protein
LELQENPKVQKTQLRSVDGSNRTSHLGLRVCHTWSHGLRISERQTTRFLLPLRTTIFRKTQEFGLQQEYQKRGVVYLIVKQLIALALLPENEIFEGFSVCFEFLMNYYSICSYIVNMIWFISIRFDRISKNNMRWTNKSTPRRPRCLQIFLYLINELLAPRSWTGNIQRLSWRTNNAIECWDRWFNERVLVAHPGFFKCTSKTNIFNK